VTLQGQMLAHDHRGLVVVERFSSFPGMGKFMVVDSLQGRDYTVVQAVVVGHDGRHRDLELLVDLLYGGSIRGLQYE
jgi:ABC-type dipeptide/oligopeptide/nickel transport system permease component